MSHRARFVLMLLAAASAPAMVSAQRPAAASSADRSRPVHAVRRDIPLTDMIRRAFAAGTRDSTGRPGRNYWQLSMDYTIAARFEPTTRIVSGRETAVLHNNSDSAFHSIVLRLDQNLFAANVPRAERVSDITEGMKLTRLSVNGEAIDLTKPDVAHQIILTSARIPIATPIPAKGTGTIEAEWSFRVPRSDSGRGDRMGSWGDSLFQVAQWYPRVAVYDDLRGWDTDPYLGPSEFYNNFGRFDLKLDLPSGWLVGASGVLQNPEEVLTVAERERLSHVLESDSTRTILGASDFGPAKATAAGDANGRVIWHFVADSVADVAWATSNRFVWDATRAEIPGKGQIPINIMYLPGHANSTNGHGFGQSGPRVRHALEFYSKLWMPYAFPVMTQVDGPEGGMEYPMFIMSGWGAADHETGHEWWPMMVGVNETWYGFMDEGFNQYMNILSEFDSRHEPPKLDSIGQEYGQISGNEREAPLMWDANYGGPMYGFQAYGKAPMMLSMLGGIVGDSAVWRAMSAYAKAWRFKHPSPWDYAFFMDGELHQDLGWFWCSWLFTTDAVDGSIQKVTTSGNRTTVVVKQDGQMPSPVILAVQFARAGPAIRQMSNSRMADSVTAIVTYPGDVWFSGQRTFTAALDFGGRKIEKITLDPHARFPDRDPTDNVWPRQAASAQTGGHGK